MSNSLRPHGLYIQSTEFSRPEYWSVQLFPSPVNVPNPEVKSRSPALQADSLPSEPPGKPKNYGRYIQAKQPLSWKEGNTISFFYLHTVISIFESPTFHQPQVTQHTGKSSYAHLAHEKGNLHIFSFIALCSPLQKKNPCNFIPNRGRNKSTSAETSL